LFYIYFKQEKEYSLKKNTTSFYSFNFPNFGNYSTPFLNSKKQSFLEFSITNIIWLLFLLLPIIILFLGYIFRYNFIQYFEHSIYFENFIDLILKGKSEDFLSILVDVSHLIAMFFLVSSIIEITSSGNLNLMKNFKMSPLLLLFIFSIILFLTLTFFKIIPSLSYYYKFSDGFNFNKFFLSYLFVSNFCLWIYFLFKSINKISILGALTSIIIIIMHIRWI
jgi:hypothetical protein